MGPGGRATLGGAPTLPSLKSIQLSSVIENVWLDTRKDGRLLAIDAWGCYGYLGCNRNND